LLKRRLRKELEPSAERFKRAKSSEVLLGDASYHRELMMQNWAS
jgi:hypothetical protein